MALGGEGQGGSSEQRSLSDLCLEVARGLQQAHVRPEALAEFVPAGRRLLVLPRAATMRALGEAWRLGALLLGVDGRLWAAGQVTRAAERGRAGYQSLSLEDRRDIAAAALHGGFAPGVSVNFDVDELPLDKGSIRALSTAAPIGYADGEVRVRWRVGATLEGAPTLEQYLRERAELLINPPLGAS